MSTRFAIALAGTCGLLLLAGCSFDSRGLPAGGRQVTVPLAVMRCPVSAQPLDVTLSSPSAQFPQVQNYQAVAGLWENKGQPYPVYVEGQGVVWDIGYDQLKGALQIQTGLADAGINAPQFLSITLHHNSRAFYLAYDSRTNPKPAWLTGPASEYTPEIDPSTLAPYYITTTLKDLSTTANKLVRLEVWRRKVTPKSGDVVTIPGNNYGAPGWGTIPPDNRAMYIVLIKPEQFQNCSIGDKVTTDWWWECVTEDEARDEQRALDRGKTLAVQWCEGRHPGLRCEPTVLIDSEGKPHSPWVGPWESSCTLTIYGSALKQTERGFSVNSEIEFLSPKSQASVTVQGKQYATAVKGKLYFDYLLQTHDIRLNDMHLQLDPLATDVGTFKNITSTLATFSTAHCQDSLLVYNQPCKQYRVPQGEFITGESYDLEGKTTFLATANDQSIDITIDHINRTFQIAGGPLSSSLDVNGKAVPVALSLDLTGHFVNFAPIAVGRESTRYVECTENSNDRPVFLSAAGSFDVYDQLPANPTTFQWYEDYGLVTEKLWGQTKTVTIGPHQLGFGVHKFTLVVHDKNGVAGTDTVPVTVGDSKPPTLSVPPDVLVPQPAAAVGPQKVDIGKAGGSDACSMKPVISNDAPAGLVFQPGVTGVTWTADDRRGNLITKVQKVSLLAAQPLQKTNLKKHFSTLAGIAQQVETGLRACRGLDQCPLDLSTLRIALEELAAVSKAEPGLEDRQRLLSTLDTARRTVVEIEKALAESNANASRRARLRDTAIRRAVALTALLRREAR